MTRVETGGLDPSRFSREWWLVKVRSALWVVLVTLLVWVWADIEFTDEMELSAPLSLAPALPQETVLLGATRVPVVFKAEGRRSDLERLERRLRQDETLLVHEVAPGETQLATRDVLNAHPLLRTAGVSVISAAPQTIPVRTDRRIYKADLPVRLEYAGAFPSTVTIEPPRVGVHVAESDWQELVKADPAPTLRTVQVDLRKVEPGKPFSVELIRRIGDAPVEPDRQSVRVTVEIAQLTETQTITVPVQVVSPPVWLADGTWREYVLTRRDPLEWRVDLQLTGPRKDLDRLQPKDVQAFVMLTEEDKKPVSWLTRQVDVRLPRDLNLQLASPRPSVSFKLEKAPPAGP